MAGTASPVDQDVLIVGAGISGIGMAVHLQMYSPGRSFSLAERRSDLGGTWDLFRYPASVPTATCTRSVSCSSPGSMKSRSPTARPSSNI